MSAKDSAAKVASRREGIDMPGWTIISNLPPLHFKSVILKRRMPASTPQEVYTLFVNAFNSGDVEGIVALYEAEAVYASGGVKIRGRESLRTAYAGIVAGGAQMILTTRSVIESGDDLAILWGEWSIGAPAGTAGLSTEVVRRQPDGSWLFVIDSPYTPPR